MSNASKPKQITNSTAATGSIFDKWNDFSTGKKIISIVAICCIGLIILGVIGSIVSPDANTSSSSSSNDAEAQQITDDWKVRDANGNDYENPYTSSSSSSSSSSSNSNSDSDDGIGDASLQVRVISSGSWQGSVGTTSKIKSVSGSGDKVINLDGSGWDIASAVIQKDKGDSSTLTVQLIKDGKVKSEESTNAAYGVVSVSD